MPELPEVEITARGIKKVARGKIITNVWTDYGSPYHLGKSNIKDREFFKKFKAAVVGKKINDASRRGKHILIHLSGRFTILVHMKMTGHFLYGRYRKTKAGWLPVGSGPLNDPFNKFVHVVFCLSNGRHLAFSDLRKFAKVTFFKDKESNTVTDLSVVGPEPLTREFTLVKFKERLKTKKVGKIKQVLMDQRVIAGIGNIYGDEILFEAGVHPEERVFLIPEKKLAIMFKAMKKILKEAIRAGGDSTSDYRNIEGKPGSFQKRHQAYQKTGTPCLRKDGGIIKRIVINGRSAHFCSAHQKLLKRKKQVS